MAVCVTFKVFIISTARVGSNCSSFRIPNESMDTLCRSFRQSASRWFSIGCCRRWLSNRRDVKGLHSRNSVRIANMTSDLSLGSSF